MGKSIKKNYLYNILLNISKVIFPLITAPYVSRVLEPDGVGLFNFSHSYAGYFTLIAMLGIPIYGTREVSKVKDDKKALTNLVSQIMSISIISTFIISLIYICTIILIGQLTENYLIFLIAGFSIYLVPFSINWYYQGLEEFSFITLRTIIIKTLSVICLFLFVKQKNDLIIYVILNVSGTVIADIWNFFKMKKTGIQPYFTYKDIRQHIKPLFTLFASSIYTILDTLMLGFIKDYVEVGYYSTAMHMSKSVLTVVTSLSLVAIPRISYYMKNNEYDKINDLINKSFSIITFLSVPAAIGLACISCVFVPLFFGQQFVGAIVPLMILSMLIIIIGLNNLTGTQILVAMGFDNLFLYSVLAGTLSNLFMNCVFIPLWGAIGASIASIIAEILVLFVTVFYVNKNTNIRIQNKMDFLKALIGSLTFIPLVFCLHKYIDGWFLVGTFVIVGVCVYFVVELFLKNKSVNLFYSVIKNKIKNKKDI